MKFPKRVKHRGRVLAVIYGKSKSYPLYRVSWSVNGKRKMKAFDRFGGDEGANQYAETLVKDLAKGSQTTALTSTQAIDALAAIERLQSFYQATGRRISLLGAISEFAEAAGKLNGHTLSEALDGYLRTVATVKRKLIDEAAEMFIKGREEKTKSKDGKRPQLSDGYAKMVAGWLREFARTFPGTSVSDLTKEHLNLYMGQHSKVGPKARNERRNVVRMFLRWCVRQDYLSSQHRLFEADGLTQETADPGEIEFFSPKELRLMLEQADDELRPIIAIRGLAGVRFSELKKLTWEQLFRIPEHIEINVSKSKTRSRRLVTIVPALEQWLAPYRQRSGPLWTGSRQDFHGRFATLLNGLKIPHRSNGLRHGFVSYHLALHANENLTAMESGNSPQVIHEHYKGLATKAEAEKWFGTMPTKADNVVLLAAANDE